MKPRYIVETRCAIDRSKRTECVIDTHTGREVQRFLYRGLAERDAEQLNARHIEAEQDGIAELLNGYDPLHAAHASTDEGPTHDDLEAWACPETSSDRRRYTVVVDRGKQTRYLIHDRHLGRSVHETLVEQHAYRLADVFEAESRAAFEMAWKTLTEDDDDDTGIPLADRLIAEADRLDAGQSLGLVSFRWMAAMLRDLALAAKATDAKDIAQAIELREVMG